MIACSHPLDITYILGADRKSITFYPCGYTSHHPQDVAERYCVRCHRWMDLIQLAREMTSSDYQFGREK